MRVCVCTWRPWLVLDFPFAGGGGLDSGACKLTPSWTTQAWRAAPRSWAPESCFWGEGDSCSRGAAVPGGQAFWKFSGGFPGRGGRQSKEGLLLLLCGAGESRSASWL